MPRTPNPPAFVAAVEAHLAPARGQFNHEQMRHTFLDTERFYRWAAVVDRRRPLAGARMLSSGCGFGGSLLAYHDSGCTRVTGVEVDADYARMAGLRVAGVPGAGVVQVAPQRPLPFPAGSFDVIESLDVLEHTADPAAYLAELRRVLAPGGVILLVTPNRLWPVEQHLGIAGPPWLPVAVADAAFTALARLPWPDRDRRFRYAALRGMRTHNISLRRLRSLVRRHRLHLELLRPLDAGEEAAWPLPLDQPRATRLLDHRWGKFISPVRTLAVLLRHAGAADGR